MISQRKYPGDFNSDVLCLLIYTSTNKVWRRSVYLGIDVINKQVFFTSW